MLSVNSFKQNSRQTVNAEFAWLDADRKIVCLKDMRLPGSAESIPNIILEITPPMVLVQGETIEVEVRMVYTHKQWEPRHPLYLLPIRIKHRQGQRFPKNSTTTSVLGSSNWRAAMVG
jgi:hypothetical protein